MMSLYKFCANVLFGVYLFTFWYKSACLWIFLKVFNRCTRCDGDTFAVYGVQGFTEVQLAHAHRAHSFLRVRPEHSHHPGASPCLLPVIPASVLPHPEATTDLPLWVWISFPSLNFVWMKRSRVTHFVRLLWLGVVEIQVVCVAAEYSIVWINHGLFSP